MSQRTIAVLCCLLLAAPFLFTRYPPITDLPQQSAQIRLFIETLTDPQQSPYRIQWFTPYSLSYGLLGVSWALLGSAYAGSIAMLLIVLLWIIAIHLIAYQRQRAPSAAVVASVFVLNHVVYWGFYSFAVGFPAFLIWIHLVTRIECTGLSLKRALAWIACGLLLYMSHSLWFVAGVAWFVVYSVLFRVRLREVIIYGALLLPLIIVTAVWYLTFSRTVMATPPVWVTGPLDRVMLSGLTESALGGMRGPVEIIVLITVLAWTAVSLIQNRTALRTALDFPLLVAGGMFLILALTLPDKYMNTIRFWQRWMPPACVLVVLAMPVPSMKPILRQAVGLAILGTFCATTAITWTAFEKRELSGLQDVLDRLPQNPKVFGLDLVKYSAFVTGMPFIQVSAYSQVFKGGTLNFSFAEFPSCLVVYKNPFKRQWTAGLEWFPECLQEQDPEMFDYAVINGTEEQYAVLNMMTDSRSRSSDTPHDATLYCHTLSRLIPTILAHRMMIPSHCSRRVPPGRGKRWSPSSFCRAFRHLSPVTHTGRWRLYKVIKERLPELR